MAKLTMPNFTPRAQQMLSLARKETDRLGHEVVDLGHLLLGMMRLGDGRGCRALQNMGLTFEAVSVEAVKLIGCARFEQATGNIPYAPRLKRLFALAAREALARKHQHTGTGHFLLGMFQEQESARALNNLGVDSKRAEEEIALAFAPRE